MYMTLLAQIYPDIALVETRLFVTKGYPGLPDGEYGILESYCLDPKCDCRRVMLNVNSRRDAEAGRVNFLASISYGFDRNDEFAGPELDPLNPRSKYAEALLEIVQDVLKDPNYVARLKNHYRLAKKAASDPDPAIRKKVAQLLSEEEDILSGNKAAGSGSEAKKRTSRPFEEPGTRISAAEKAQSVPKAMRPIFESVVAITDAFCREHLDEEYAQLSRELAAALTRKRPSPLARGKPQVWACGIVYALGSVNFLWDKSEAPYMSAGELCQRFGVGKSTGSARARSIMDMMRMIQLAPRWCLPSKMEDNPLVWMLSINGLLMDIRDAPWEAQEEALRKGLIPYIPSTRGNAA